MIADTILLLAAGIFGFFLGRFSVNRISEENEAEENPEEEQVQWQKRDRKATGMVEKYSVGSPVAGMVVRSNAGENPTVVIRPEGGKLFAPTGGKITRLYPGGKDMLFTTEFGAEMHISVGEVQDDLLERYYRPRVIQNEVVPKGKLLLEFDVQGLAAEGETADVSLRMERYDYDTEVVPTAEGRVKAGEDILKIF